MLQGAFPYRCSQIKIDVRRDWGCDILEDRMQRCFNTPAVVIIEVEDRKGHMREPIIHTTLGVYGVLCPLPLQALRQNFQLQTLGFAPDLPHESCMHVRCFPQFAERDTT